MNWTYKSHVFTIYFLHFQNDDKNKNFSILHLFIQINLTMHLEKMILSIVGVS